jgi:hypothetical protein
MSKDGQVKAMLPSVEIHHIYMNIYQIEPRILDTNAGKQRSLAVTDV